MTRLVCLYRHICDCICLRYVLYTHILMLQYYFMEPNCQLLQWTTIFQRWSNDSHWAMVWSLWNYGAYLDSRYLCCCVSTVSYNDRHTGPTAHTTQFSEIGYMYLKAGSGAGHLASGGSYVTLMDTITKDFTIIIETMVLSEWNATILNICYYCMSLIPTIWNTTVAFDSFVMLFRATITPSVSGHLSLRILSPHKQPLSSWKGAW